MYTTSVHAQILCQFFPTAKQGLPFSISGCANPRFHMGILVWKGGLVFLNLHTEMGIPHFHMGMCQSLFFMRGSPYGNFFGGQNFWQCSGTWCVTQWPAKTTVPLSIWGVPMWKRASRLRNSHLGTPCSQTEFVPIWGLIYLPKGRISLCSTCVRERIIFSHSL
jgi:hypothetical protein